MAVAISEASQLFLSWCCFADRQAHPEPRLRASRLCSFHGSSWARGNGSSATRSLIFFDGIHETTGWTPRPTWNIHREKSWFGAGSEYRSLELSSHIVVSEASVMISRSIVSA